MSRWTLQAAVGRQTDGLLNLHVLVCDRDGSLVAGLSGDAFGCVASASTGAPDLRREDFVEAHPGCYRLALHHEPHVRVDVLAVSVLQRVRTNPSGLAPVYATGGEGHVLVSLPRPGGR